MIRAKERNVKCDCKFIQKLTAKICRVWWKFSAQLCSQLVGCFEFNQSDKRLAFDTRTDPDQIYQILCNRETNPIQSSDFGLLSQINSIKKRVHFYKQNDTIEKCNIQ